MSIKGKQKKELVNEEITSKEVRLIDQDGTQLGIVSIEDALAKADEADLDLVQVVVLEGQANVCKIMNYSKHVYQEQKRAKAAKKNQTHIEVREVKLSPGIGEHDYQVRLKNVNRFISRGDKVKVTVQMSKRELAHPELAVKVAERIIQDMGELVVVDSKPVQNGRMVRGVLSPANPKK